jgi:hypothetical protein
LRLDTAAANLGVMSHFWEKAVRLTAMLVAQDAWQTSWSLDPCGALATVDIAREVAGANRFRPLPCTSGGVVAVDRGPLHARAVCSCGWVGRQHLLPAVAIHDAHLHAAENRCLPAVPLIARDASRRPFPLFH